MALLLAIAVGLFVTYRVGLWGGSEQRATSSSQASSQDSGTNGDASKSTADSGKESNDSTDSDAKKQSETATNLFKNVAGTYVWMSSGTTQTTISVDETGSFTGKYMSVTDPDNYSLQSAPDSAISSVSFTGKFSSITANDANGYVLQCDEKALQFSGDLGANPNSGMFPCGAWQWFPNGTPFSTVSEASGGQAEMAGPEPQRADQSMINKGDPYTFFMLQP
ncbi:hypothetical protein [Bifidobacterium colobi]|uniref:hypothetical protein n=1 Tax=Bifidobacterium colobi TaxID=2809026 RepID=UPI001F0A3E1A|nr:hypothetical protein [Bifidobacterium colobi]